MKLSPFLVALAWFVVVATGFGVMLALDGTVRPGAWLFVGVCSVGAAGGGYWIRRRELAGLPRGVFPDQSPMVASVIVFLLVGLYAGGFSYFLADHRNPLVWGSLWGTFVGWLTYRTRRGMKTSYVRAGVTLFALLVVSLALEIFLEEIGVTFLTSTS